MRSLQTITLLFVITLIKVDAIGSTNSFLRKLVRNNAINQPTCIWAKHQTEGRGQIGNAWKTESGKNLTISVYLPISPYLTYDPIAINLLTALSIYNVLDMLKVPQLFIKWPNDIMSANKKIGGILIENNYQNGTLSESIIGIGLNVNQRKFDNLPKASSLKLITKQEFDIKLLLNKILIQLEKSFSNFDSSDFPSLKKRFESVLFRKGKASSFKRKNSESIFTGIIKGITNDGKLTILEEDNVINHYNLKEISLLY